MKENFQNFLTSLQLRKDFDGTHESHVESALIIFGSVDPITHQNSLNLDGTFKHISLAKLIGSLLDEGYLIEEIATHCFTEPQTIALYYNIESEIYYAIILQ